MKPRYFLSIRSSYEAVTETNEKSRQGKEEQGNFGEGGGGEFKRRVQLRPRPVTWLPPVATVRTCEFCGQTVNNSETTISFENSKVQSSIFCDFVKKTNLGQEKVTTRETKVKHLTLA
jgi:hypothetical protein